MFAMTNYQIKKINKNIESKIKFKENKMNE